MVRHATVLPKESNHAKEILSSSTADISDSNVGLATGASSPTTSASDSDITDGVERHVPAAHNALHLQRRVGLLSGVALIVGTMIGSGIFVSPSDLLKRTQSPALFLIIWVACGILSMLGALSYAELGTMITQSGAEYAYFRQAFGPIPAFLFCWVCTLVLKPSQLAIICLAFAKYTVEAFVNECEPPELIIKLLCASTIGLITFVNCFSVSLATKVQNVFTAAKLVAIAVVIAGGLYKIAMGNTQYLAQGFDGPKASIGDIATAFYSGLWAYDGWNNLNYVTEELKNPFINLPRAIMIGIPLTTVCYLLVNVAYLAVLSPSEMIASEAVAVTFGNRALGPLAWLMPLAVCISTFGSANGTLFVGGRLCYVASREGHLVDILSYVHIKRLTPSPALLFNTVIALAMIIPGDIESLIDFFSFTAWIFYGGAMLALIVLRFTMKDAPRPYKVPIIIPALVLVISIYLVIAPIVDNPKWEYLYATMFILAGLVVYVPFVHYKVVLPGMGRVTAFLQLVLEVAPSSAAED